MRVRERRSRRRSFLPVVVCHLPLTSLPIPPPFLYPSDRREPGPAGVSDGVVALGGMEWRECDGTVRDKPQGAG